MMWKANTEKKVVSFFVIVIDLLLFLENQYQYILFRLSNSLRVDVKILKSFVVLSLKKSLFPIYMQMFLFPKPTFHFKDVLVLLSVVQKLLILMELREKYMTLDQHTRQHLASGFS